MMSTSTGSPSSFSHSTVTPNSKTLDLNELLNGPPASLNDDQVSVTARLLVDCRCRLGESVLYDDRSNSILFVSILNQTFHKLDLNINDDNDEGELKTFALPKMVASFGLLDNRDAGGYIVAWEDGFQLYDLEKNESLSPMSTGEIVNPLGLPDRLNDGRVDPTGKYFVCGGYAGSYSGSLKVYKCEWNPATKQLTHTPIVDAIQMANSICWSLDGKIMYLSDSGTKQIHQYDYNLEQGTLSNKRNFHRLPVGYADGSCVDSHGFVWNAVWPEGDINRGMVNRLDPQTGHVVFTVYLPDSTTEATCCCFGGPNLDILFITTAWELLDPSTHVHAGGLYAVKLPSGMVGNTEKKFRAE